LSYRTALSLTLSAALASLVWRNRKVGPAA